jgi:hypothetical protein
MDRTKIKERLELALRPAEPPTLEEVLEQVSTSGVLRGPVDWVFPAWMLYVEYVTQKIAETFPLSEEEKSQLLHFRDAMKQLLLKAWMQTKEKLAALYKAVAEGTYRMEGKRLYAPDGARIDVKDFVPRIPIHGVNASARFPDILKLPRERLELLQLGWRASDESEVNRYPYMGTSQPWQVFAWVTVRHGRFRIYIASVNLTCEGVSVKIRIVAKSWKEQWNKVEAVNFVVNHLRRGEWAPLLTMWLGDGIIDREEIMKGKRRLIIAIKEPWRLGIKGKGKYTTQIDTGREAFVKLREVAGIYGKLLDLLEAHKWVIVKLATDDALRANHKSKTKKRSIDILKETYNSNDKIPAIPHVETDKPGTVAVAGVVMHLELIRGKAGSLYAKQRVKNLGHALAIAERLESAGLRPNIVKDGSKYKVYIAFEDLIKMAERDETVRRAVALYLAEKAKNGTPRQREIAENILKRHPLFRLPLSLKHLSPWITKCWIEKYRTNNGRHCVRLTA